MESASQQFRVAFIDSFEIPNKRLEDGGGIFLVIVHKN
jgi:hypothetical protein